MASLKRICTLSLACGGLLLGGHAVAQSAQSPGEEVKTDVSGQSAERFDDKHLTIWHSGPSGPVEVVQNGARLVCDTLYVYSYGPGEGPNAAAQPGKSAPAPAPAPAKGAAPGAAPDAVGGESIKQMVAEGHVFYVTQNQTVRGERAVYDTEPDIITMIGSVVAVQGKNVAKGDKMVIDRKTNHTTMVSDATGRNNPNRVRGVFYNQNQDSQGQAQAAPAKKP